MAGETGDVQVHRAGSLLLRVVGKADGELDRGDLCQVAREGHVIVAALRAGAAGSSSGVPAPPLAEDPSIVNTVAIRQKDLYSAAASCRMRATAHCSPMSSSINSPLNRQRYSRVDPNLRPLDCFVARVARLRPRMRAAPARLTHPASTSARGRQGSPPC